MRLPPGAKLGPYEVLSLLGAGGMGEVYRARDPRLNREVAIKVLPADRVIDEAHRRRFVQEAQAASALNHPNIVTIHEIESADGVDFIVMEYVRGKSLDALIPRPGMRLNEALRIAIAVADALVTAHARGIVHRDLKPANVMVGTDGTVKVLDFGLAKLIRDADTPEHESPTRTSHALVSAPGTIAGTAAYMAPEQATGGTVDARTDIFSFGAMLYEMVTGSRAFPGASTADTINAVIRAEPKPPSAVVAETQGDLEKVILRCLRKDPQRRYQHIDDVKVALQEIKEESESGSATAAPRPRARRRSLVALVVGSAIVMGAVAVWLLRSSRATDVTPPRVVPLTTLTGNEFSPTFSPDGSQVAFQWGGEKDDNQDVYVKIIGSTETRRLTTDPVVEAWPSWSPDGRQIAFVRCRPADRPPGCRLQLTSPLGSAAVKLSDLPVHSRPAWSPDSRYIAIARFAPSGSHEASGIFLISTEGGEPRQLTRATEPAFDHSPAFSPDGRHLAYASCTDFYNCVISVVGLDAALRVTGAPRALTANMTTALAGLAWSRDGREVIYGTSWPRSLGYLRRVGVDGTRPPERIEIAGLGVGTPATASTRDRLAFSRNLSHEDVYRFVAGHSPEPVLTSSFDDHEPALSPDGRRVVFGSSRSGEAMDIWVANADGSGAQQLTRGPGRWQGSPHWSPDGRQIVFDSFGADQHWHIWIVDAEGGIPHQLTKNPGDQVIPSFSHDGRWIYFSAGRGGKRDVWRVRPTGGEPQRVTNGGSSEIALEFTDGRSLLYTPKEGEAPLLMMPLTGGSVRTLVTCVQGRLFAAARAAVYYVACGPAAALHRLNPSTGEDRVLGTLENVAYTLTVSADETTILYDRDVITGADLWLIENFR